MRFRRILTSTTFTLLLLVMLLSGVSNRPAFLRPALAHGDDEIFGPTSAASGRIAFAQNQDIFVMDSDGSKLQQLTFTGSRTPNYQPALSPDGTQVAFGTYDGSKSEILIINSDGTGGVTSLTTSTVTYVGEPAWSPDGTQIAFVRGGDPTASGIASSISCGSEVYRINVATPQGKAMSVTNGRGGTDPSWSPDGSDLAFVSDRDGNFEIFKYNFALDKLDQLTFTPENEAEPSWSPEGQLIVYARGYLSSQTNCGFAHTGLGQVTLVEGPDIYVMAADGSGVVRRTETGNCFDPVWSPDGSTIAFVSFKFGATQVFISGPANKEPLAITTENSEKSSPSWSR